MVLQNSPATASLDRHFLFSQVTRRLWTVLLAALVGLSALLVYAHWLYAPKYHASVVLCVSTPSSPAGAYADLPSTSAMAEQYAPVLEDPVLLQRAAAHMGLAEFPGTLTAAAVDDLNLIEVTVTADSAATAEAALLAVLDIHPSITELIFTNAMIAAIETPRLSESPSNPISAAWFWLVPAAAAGLQLMILVLRSMFGSTIQHEADYCHRITHPLSATICSRAFCPQLHREDLRKLAAILEHHHLEHGSRTIFFTGTTREDDFSTLVSGISDILSGNGYIVRSEPELSADQGSDFILLDGPALGDSAAAAAIAASVDLICFVIRTGHSSAVKIAQTLEVCQQLTSAPVLCVLNGTHPSYRKRSLPPASTG